MVNKRKLRKGADSSSSYVSSSDETSTEATRPRRRRSSDALAASEAQRTTRTKLEDKVIRMLEEIKLDTSEMRKQSKKLTENTRKMRKQLKELVESHNELRKQLELHINGSSGDDSAAPRSQTSQEHQQPKYKLQFTCDVNDQIEKGQIIETKNHGNKISVALYDDHNQIVTTGPFASARVMLVVVNGDFNQHGNQYNWSRKEFERNIKRPRQGNSATRDENQPVESIVCNGTFTLHAGVQSHSNATIVDNSSNKKVRLGAMVLAPTEERVLEGLSNLFYVRGHDRPARQCKPCHSRSKRQNHDLGGYGYQERNSPMPLIMQNLSSPNLPQAERFDTAAATQEFPENTATEAGQQQDFIPQHQFSLLGTSMASATYNLPAGDDQILLFGDNFTDPNLARYSFSIGNDHFPFPTNGTQFNNMNQIARPVQLLWDRPNVEPSKRWNLLDHLMPLYSCQQKINNSGLPTMRFMTENFGSLTIVPKEVMQACRKRGVLIEPLEPGDSDEERPLKRKLHNKYQLRFVNEVCEAYYTWEQIKAEDGNLLKVALFDENNTKITSGPLSSASVEVVVLHGDFNVDGQDYWTSEEFGCCLVCPRPEKDEPVLGGDSILVLADGEACLHDAFFMKTSVYARNGKFKMGVMLDSIHENRVQEGISEPFRVRDYSSEELRAKYEPTLKALPPGFRFQPTDEELIVHYIRKRGAAAPCSMPIVAEVDIYKFDPWDLPPMALFGDHEWYFRDHKYPSGTSPNDRAAGSGYWRAIGTDTPIICSTADCKMIGTRKVLVFYKGRPPTGHKTAWVMHEYSLPAESYNTPTSSSTASSMTLDEWVLCRIIRKRDRLMLSQQPMSTDGEGLGQPPTQLLPYTDLPPGFRFCPTDNELIFHYLHHRATAAPIIPEVDIYKFDPWDLPAKAAFGERQWYFFCPLHRKYPNGARPSRATGSGYWKAISANQPIILSTIHGLKKTLIFYKGRPPAGIKTRWIMHEYRLMSTINSTTEDEWSLCRIYKKRSHLPPSLPLEKDSTMLAPLEESFAFDSPTPTYDLPLPPSPSSIDDYPMHETDTAEVLGKLSGPEKGLAAADALQRPVVYRCSTEPRPQGSGWSELVCTDCFTLLVCKPGASNIRCPHCGRVNSARSVNQLGHLPCGHCRTTLAYPPGATTVGCPACRWVNPVRNNSPTSSRPAASSLQTIDSSSRSADENLTTQKFSNPKRFALGIVVSILNHTRNVI